MTGRRRGIGLVRPAAGTALIDGRPYASLARPRRVVGAVLEATGFHPGRRGRQHLRILAEVTGVPDRRVHEGRLRFAGGLAELTGTDEPLEAAFLRLTSEVGAGA